MTAGSFYFFTPECWYQQIKLLPVKVLVAIAAASSNSTSSDQLRQNFPKEKLVGFMRDLRGITTATNTRKSHGELQSTWSKLCKVYGLSNQECLSQASANTTCLASDVSPAHTV